MRVRLDGGGSTRCWTTLPSLICCVNVEFKCTVKKVIVVVCHEQKPPQTEPDHVSFVPPIRTADSGSGLILVRLWRRQWEEGRRKDISNSPAGSLGQLWKACEHHVCRWASFILLRRQENQEGTGQDGISEEGMRQEDTSRDGRGRQRRSVKLSCVLEDMWLVGLRI